MMKAAKTWVLIILLLLPAVNVHAWPIPDTGQTKCYNNTTEIPCPTPGEAFYGQDGNYSTNPQSYTKLDAIGNALPDSATSWTMVRDNVKGLIWENKTYDNTIHDGSKTFTWCDTNSETNGGNQGTCGTGTGEAATDTEAFIKALNDENFGGFSDWRMPTPKELTSIVDWGRNYPSLNTAWFPNTMAYITMSSHYWSSTSSNNPSFIDYAWCVRFYDSYVAIGNKASVYPVRAVRSGPPGSLDHLVINGDGTVTDTATGLMWQQGTVSGKTWQEALAYAETLTLADYDDWRLPNITELQSIVDYGRYNPTIDTTAFPGTLSSRYWSSSTAASSNGNAGCVNFSNGDISNSNNTCYKTDINTLRAVRSGQSWSVGNLVISKSGSGSVSSVPAGIDCGSTCAATFNAGTSVTLSALASPGSTFAGWSGGGCQGTSPCTVNVTKDGVQVEAPFTLTGDVGKDGKVDLSDAILGLKIMAGDAAGQTINVGADVNGDGKIGLAEVIYVLQSVSGYRDYLDQVRDLLLTVDTAVATAVPSTGAQFTSWQDACYLHNGKTKAFFVTEFDANVAESRAENAYIIGSTRMNAQVLAERNLTNPDASTRKEIDIQYDIHYADGSVEKAIKTTLISGSSAGTAGCATSQTGSTLRFFGNRKLVRVDVQARNIRYERYQLATGELLEPPKTYRRDIRFSVRDPMGNATYAVITGPGPSTIVSGVYRPFSLKVVSPRIQRTDTLFAGKPGNYRNWGDNDTFRMCRVAAGLPLSNIADCVTYGASGDSWGWTTATPDVAADTGFASLGFVAGGTYRFDIYKDDGWKSVNGQATATPVAIYTAVLENLPYGFVEMAGTGPDTDLFPKVLTSSLTSVSYSGLLKSGAAGSVNLTWSLPGAMSDARVFRLTEVGEYFEGSATSVTWPAYPRYKYYTAVYPDSTTTMLNNLGITATPPEISTKNFADWELYYSDRKNGYIMTIYSYN
jgi:hypothetical protein